MITFWLTAILSIILDRISKMLVVSKMLIGQTTPLIPGFFHITYIENPGAAFGILAHKKWVFVMITIFILAVLIYLAKTGKEKGHLYTFALGLIAGGAVGNLTDRLQTGLVIDFLDFRGIWSYIFNGADSFVVTGVLLFALLILLEKPEGRDTHG